MNGSDYLKDLQDFEQQQGAARLRTIAAEFFSTLDRLPKLKQEVDAMQQMQGVNLDDLATSLEQRLDKAANLLARLDLLSTELRNARELEGFMHGIQNAMSLRTIDTWVSEFDSKCNEARTRMEQEKQLGIEMVKVPGGSYVMGGTKKQVQVNSFFIGTYPVTQGQWVAVMGDNPSEFKLTDRHPVENVNYNDVLQFINKLNQLTGRNYRLPTEEEWEYAARSGGSDETWAGTSNQQELDDYAWTNNNAGGSTQPVGLKKPNGLGIYDMSGNVWEWCNSLFEGSSARVMRGGSWLFDPESARADDLLWTAPTGRNYNIGFRLVLSSA